MKPMMAWSEAFLGELRFLVGCFLQMSEVFRKLSEDFKKLSKVGVLSIK